MRNKQHSNRYKRLRFIARWIAKRENAMVYREVRVGAGAIIKRQPFWAYGCAKRLYKDMKRDGWGGDINRLNTLVLEALNVQEKRV